MSEDKKEQEKQKQEDLQKRVKALNEELMPLLAKYKLGLGAVPFYSQNANGEFITLAKSFWFDDSRSAQEEKKDEKVEKSDIAKAE